MDPTKPVPSRLGTRLPRVSGDGPAMCFPVSVMTAAAPRERGWTLKFVGADEKEMGCPA